MNVNLKEIINILKVLLIPMIYWQKKYEETEIDVNNRNKVLLNGTLQDNNLPK